MERPPFIEGGVRPVTMGALAVVAAGLTRRKRRGGGLAFKDDASYIGYLTDDDEIGNGGNGGNGGGGGGGDGGSMDVAVYRRRRNELIGSDGGADLSFSNCLFVIVTFCVLLALFLFAVSPWGVPPPRRL